MGIKITTLLASAGLILSAGIASASVTVEAPSATNTTQDIGNGGVVTFDDIPGGYQNSYTATVGAITATFEGLFGSNGNTYGGAGGSKYAFTQGTATATLSQAVTYLGIWATALDGGNAIQLTLNGANVGGEISLAGYPLSDAYKGNPSDGYSNGGEKYAFFNINSDTAFDGFKLVQNGGGGFEFDNITLGGAVPEPATWAMLLAGFGMIGFAMRKRERRISAAI